MSSYFLVSNCGTTPQSGPNIEILNRQFVNESGDTLRGTINMNGHPISNIADPKQPSDVVNVQYVTNEIMDVNKKINGLNKSVVDMHDVTENLGKLFATNKLEIQKSVDEQKKDVKTLAKQFNNHKEDVMTLANQFMRDIEQLSTSISKDLKKLEGESDAKLKETGKFKSDIFKEILKLKETTFKEIKELQLKMTNINSLQRLENYQRIQKSKGLQFWLSGFYPRGLHPQSSSNFIDLTREDALLHHTGKVQLIYNEHPCLYFDSKSNVISTYEFNDDFTFFFLAKKESGSGRLFTSKEGNKVMGWWHAYDQSLWFDQEIYWPKHESDNKIHLYSLIVKDSYIAFYDGEKSLATAYKAKLSLWKNVVIGKPLNYPTESLIGCVYEVLCYNYALNEEEINKVYTFLKTYYKYSDGSK